MIKKLWAYVKEASLKHAAAVLSGGALGALFVGLYLMPPKDSGQLASWVQAFGSIGAIGIAIVIPYLTELKDKKDKNIKVREVELNFILELHEILEGVENSLNYYHRINFELDASIEESFCTDPYQGDFQRFIPFIKPYVGRLNETPNLAPILRTYIYALISFDRYLNMISVLQETGNSAFWRNNVEYTEELTMKLLEIAQDTRDKAEEILRNANIRPISSMIGEEGGRDLSLHEAHVNAYNRHRVQLILPDLKWRADPPAS